MRFHCIRDVLGGRMGGGRSHWVWPYCHFHESLKRKDRVGITDCACTVKLWHLPFLNSEPGTSDEYIGQDIPWQTKTANVFTCNYQLGSYKKDSLGREDEREVQR